MFPDDALEEEEWDEEEEYDEEEEDDMEWDAILNNNLMRKWWKKGWNKLTYFYSFRLRLLFGCFRIIDWIQEKMFANSWTLQECLPLQ